MSDVRDYLYAGGGSDLASTIPRVSAVKRAIASRSATSSALRLKPVSGSALVPSGRVCDDMSVLVGANAADSLRVSVARDDCLPARRVAICSRRASISWLRASRGATEFAVPSVCPLLR